MVKIFEHGQNIFELADGIGTSPKKHFDKLIYEGKTFFCQAKYFLIH